MGKKRTALYIEGLVEKEALDAQLEKLLCNPGDLVICDMGDKDFLEVFVRMSFYFVLNQKSAEYENSKDSCQRFKLRKTEIEDKTKEEILKKVIEKFLVFLLFDFDQTLTITETCGSFSKEGVELRDPDGVVCIMEIIHENANFKVVMLSHSPNKNIKSYFNLWNEEYNTLAFSEDNFIWPQEMSDKKIGKVEKFMKVLNDFNQLHSQNESIILDFNKKDQIWLVTAFFLDDEVENRKAFKQVFNIPAPDLDPLGGNWYSCFDELTDFVDALHLNFMEFKVQPASDLGLGTQITSQLSGIGIFSKSDEQETLGTLDISRNTISLSQV